MYFYNMEFKNKYFKYKKKYTNLKKSRGIDIVSFNVLNYHHYIAQTIWKNFDTPLESIIIKNLGKLEEHEYLTYRKYKLLNVIKYFYSQNQIICLQEVTNNLLSELKLLYNISWTKYIKESSTQPEFRVTIIPPIYQWVSSYSIKFDKISSEYPNIKKKNCLATIILDKQTNKKFIIYNVHIYWKCELIHYKHYAKLISDDVFKYNLPFIICGDFNATLDDPLMIAFINRLQHKIELNNNNYANDFTSSDTRSKTMYGWIDHIITSGFIIKEQTITMAHVGTYDMMYNIRDIYEKIMQIPGINLKLKKFIPTKQLVQLFAGKNWVSDHKPVVIKLIL